MLGRLRWSPLPEEGVEQYDFSQEKQGSSQTGGHSSGHFSGHFGNGLHRVVSEWPALKESEREAILRIVSGRETEQGLGGPTLATTPWPV